jgi:uncharacterized membrane protein
MRHTISAFSAVPVGIMAGLRVMTPVAAVSWKAHAGGLKLRGTPLAFLGHPITPWIFTAGALGELVNDQLPKTASRTVPVQFAARILSGGLCGAALGAAAGSWRIGAIAGVGGAILGTLGGAAIRRRLASAFGKDRPAALLEDVVAIGGSALVAGLPR